MLFRSTCSHAEVALSEGDVTDCQIECWLHGSMFDLRTGKPTNLPATESWFIAASVPARFIAVASFAVLAATGLAPAKVMIFAAVDGMGAVWTRLTLKS